jgi:hypothetical protein
VRRDCNDELVLEFVNIMTTAALQGRLDSFRLSDVLTFLASTKKCGTLKLMSEDKETYVFLDGGAVIYAGSSQESFRLSAILMRKKKITRAQHDAIERLMESSGGRFGQIAVQQGIVTEPQLYDFLKIQVSEIIYDCFVWKSGQFAFADKLELPPYAVTISVDLTNLIMEGARRITEWEECVRLLPDNRAVYRVVSNPEAEKITLSLEEWKILFLINGHRTLEELCHDAEDDPFNVYRVIYGLLANKLIEVAPPDLDDSNPLATTPVPAMMDETFKQAPANFSNDSTVTELPPRDDTSLLVSAEAKLSLADVVKLTVAQLSISSGENIGTVFPLIEQEYLIGRGRDNQIQLNDLGVSGRHARIYRGAEGYVIEDLKSRNGTWLNGARVYHSQLEEGDTVRIGATDLRFNVLYE